MKDEKYSTYPEVEAGTAGTTAPGRDVYASELDVFGDESNAQVSRALVAEIDVAAR